jgi:5-methylcytosine-specific restriction protein A
MPYKALRPCSHQGCPNLVESGRIYCDAHKSRHVNDYVRRHPEYQKQYSSQQWMAYRKQFLAAHPLCINYDSCHNLATVVDHIVDHNGNQVLFWQPNNHQSMCKQCHDKKTASTKGWGKE